MGRVIEGSGAAGVPKESGALPAPEPFPVRRRWPKRGDHIVVLPVVELRVPVLAIDAEDAITARLIASLVSRRRSDGIEFFAG